MSKEYVILTDSCSDLSQELVNKCNIEVLPLQFEIDGKTYNHYPDDREYDFKKFYVDMRAKKSHVHLKLHLQHLSLNLKNYSKKQIILC